MEIKEHKPEPWPSTYDLLNLTEDQMIFIRDLVGKFAAGCGVGNTHPHVELFNKLERTLDARRRYSFDYYNSGTDDWRRIGSLQCTRMS